MHFWIDKPVGRYYGFSGRQYPASSLSKLHFGRCQRSRDVRPMVTPVHRFQSLNGIGSLARPSSLNVPRPIRSAIRNNIESSSGSSHSANVPLQLLRPNSISNDVNIVGHNRRSLPNTTSYAVNRGLLDFSEFSDAELAGYRLRCGVWITFVLATGFVAAIKFCFDHQGMGLEVLVFCGLLVTLLLPGCFYSIFCRRAQRTPRQELQMQDDPTIAVLTTINTTTNENIGSIPVVRQNPPPPPPYHIAISIPPSNLPEEVPPPSYDKVVH